MRSATYKLCRRFSISAALIGVALSLGAVRPEAGVRHRRRLQGQTYAWHQAGPSRHPAQGGGGSSQPPQLLIHTAAPSLPSADVQTSDVRLILKTHRIAWVPVPVRRLKLPSSQNDPF
jgi:hypothetical protein